MILFIIIFIPVFVLALRSIHYFFDMMVWKEEMQYRKQFPHATPPPVRPRFFKW